MFTRLKKTNEEGGFSSAKQKIAATDVLHLPKLFHGTCFIDCTGS